MCSLVSFFISQNIHSIKYFISQEPLKPGDLVKTDLGCHIDGYISVAAHTLVVPEEGNEAPTEVDAEIGNVAVAAYNTMLVAAASIKAGMKNAAVSSHE